MSSDSSDDRTPGQDLAKLLYDLHSKHIIGKIVAYPIPFENQCVENRMNYQRTAEEFIEAVERQRRELNRRCGTCGTLILKDGACVDCGRVFTVGQPTE